MFTTINKLPNSRLCTYKNDYIWRDNGVIFQITICEITQELVGNVLRVG